MNNDFEDFFTTAFSLVAFAVLIGLVVTAVVLGVVLLPLVAAIVFTVGGIYYYYHSPPYLERKAKEHTEALYRDVEHLIAPNRDEYLRAVHRVTRADGYMLLCADELYLLEGFEQIPPPPPVCNSLEGARYRDRLATFAAKAHNETEYQRFEQAVIESLSLLTPGRSEGAFKVSIPLTNQEIEDLCTSFYRSDDLFMALRRQLDENLEEAKVLPSEYKGDDAAFQYFKRTPLLFLHERTDHITLGNRFEHQYILAQTGHGKTTFLEFLISKDLEDDCCVIVIDSQRQLIPKLAKLALPLDDIAVISPRNPLALNIFAFGDNSNTTTELLKFVLTSLMEAPLTAKQDVVFNFAIQIMLAIPGANIDTFLQLLRDPASLQDRIERLDPTARHFFEHEFKDRQYNDTKREISWRVWSLLKNPVFARMFGAIENKVDMREEMKRKLVLIDTDADLLQSGSRFFGRLFVAMILQEANRRLQGGGRPVYVYLDEAHDVIDESIDRMLAQARKANIGITLSHQFIDQIESPKTIASVMTNTSAKFVGSLSQRDARALAGEMRTTAELIQSQKKGEFAAYIKGQTDRAVSLKVPFGALKELPQRAEDLDEEMRRRYGEDEPIILGDQSEPEPGEQSASSDGAAACDDEQSKSDDDDVPTDATDTL